jgi:hypothetical protein
MTAEGQGASALQSISINRCPCIGGKAGFNLDFLPTAYFGKSYMSDDTSGIFPRHDSWPFLWYENEYVVDAATTFILAANAAEALAH